MAKIRTLIVDDEPPARSRLRRLLEQVGLCEVVGEVGSGTEALRCIHELSPDLLLLDISMPGMDGMSLAATLRQLESPPEVVFCTAWADQALEAFDRDALDYVVKPVRLERLESAIAKVARVMGLVSEDKRPEFLKSTIGGKTILVGLDEVICLVAEDKYTTVLYDGGKTVINDSLVDLENRYPERLLRIHRNTLVASSRIRGLERSGKGTCFLALKGTGFKPPVSRRQLSAVRKSIKDLV